MSAGRIGNNFPLILPVGHAALQELLRVPPVLTLPLQEATVLAFMCARHCFSVGA